MSYTFRLYTPHLALHFYFRKVSHLSVQCLHIWNHLICMATSQEVSDGDSAWPQFPLEQRLPPHHFHDSLHYSLQGSDTLFIHPTKFPRMPCTQVPSEKWGLTSYCASRSPRHNFPLNIMCFSKENKSCEKSRWYVKKASYSNSIFQTSMLVLITHCLYLCVHFLPAFHSVCRTVWLQAHSSSFLYFHSPFPFLFYPWPTKHCSQLIPGLKD